MTKFKLKKAKFLPKVQGKIDMEYPRAGEIVTVIEECFYKFSPVDDPMCTIRFKDGSLGWWNKRDLQYL